MAIRRRFDREFKLQILQHAEHQPLAEVCREHNLHPNTVTRWKRELEQYHMEAFRGRGSTYKLEAKLGEAYRVIGQLYAEITLLKKAVQIAQEKRAEERMLRFTK